MRQPVFVHSMPHVGCIDCGLLALKVMTKIFDYALRKIPLSFESSVGVRAMCDSNRIVVMRIWFQIPHAPLYRRSRHGSTCVRFWVLRAQVVFRCFYVIVVFLVSDQSFVLDFVRGYFLTCL